MQLYALDSEQRLVLARQAIKQQDYLCIECNQIVRVRGGHHRQRHYYHLAQSQSCHLSQKSMRHLQVQAHLQSILPQGECVLEHRFSAINRIADAVWLPQKIVFEVQCSPISKEEIQARNQDYASQGFHVVWILHDSRYNQWRVSAAELALRNSPYYFTNITAEGRGIIYDQFDVISRGLRKKILGPLPLTLAEPHWLEQIKVDSISDLSTRLEWPFCFSGDLVHLCCVLGDQGAINLVSQHRPQVERIGIASFIFSIALYIAYSARRVYSLALKMLLERACR